MAHVRFIRQNQAGNTHIDGATPSYLPISINQPNQNMPHPSELSQDRRQLRHLCPKKDNSDVFPGGFASCLGISLVLFLVVLPPVLLSWWFCLLFWHNSDRCGIFWLGWLMDVGKYEGVVTSMWVFAAWFWRMSGNYVIYIPKNDLFFAIFYALAIYHFAWFRKMGPTKSPEKELFPEFPKKRGESKWKIGIVLVSPHFFSQDQAAFLGHRWRNAHSFAKIRLGMPT